jgi:hypothetical protein
MLKECKNCKFYDGEQCRRYPAVIIVVDSTPIDTWPNVDAKDWCGEFSERERSLGNEA